MKTTGPEDRKKRLQAFLPCPIYRMGQKCLEIVRNWFTKNTQTDRYNEDST